MSITRLLPERRRSRSPTSSKPPRAQRRRLTSILDIQLVQSTTSGFFKLPREIRDKVYSCIFKGNISFFHRGFVFSSTVPPVGKLVEPMKTVFMPRGALACKTLLAELMENIARDHTFTEHITGQRIICTRGLRPSVRQAVIRRMKNTLLFNSMRRLELESLLLSTFDRERLLRMLWMTGMGSRRSIAMELAEVLQSLEVQPIITLHLIWYIRMDIPGTATYRARQGDDVALEDFTYLWKPLCHKIVVTARGSCELFAEEREAMKKELEKEEE
ncbi:hypothetical protein P280DRAFT_534269 [Massarina eburnea CBS 473.64]|uniref:Uncharacterized protein n=1 Tax=Massarina eburnea CBS 473.64 TaxID=1395130 RepID=A0A6A6RKY6_9PLEO|nr:hypothetical protein P280DRAFT_534269 [Massarina eburnea CBS 473.64]